MSFLDDWEEIVRRAWSIRLMGFALFLEVASNVVPYLSDVIPWWASVLIIALAVVARVLKQPDASEASDAASKPEARE